MKKSGKLLAGGKPPTPKLFSFMKKESTSFRSSSQFRTRNSSSNLFSNFQSKHSNQIKHQHIEKPTRVRANHSILSTKPRSFSNENQLRAEPPDSTRGNKSIVERTSSIKPSQKRFIPTKPRPFRLNLEDSARLKLPGKENITERLKHLHTDMSAEPSSRSRSVRSRDLSLERRSLVSSPSLAPFRESKFNRQLDSLEARLSQFYKELPQECNIII